MKKALKVAFAVVILCLFQMLFYVYVKFGSSSTLNLCYSKSISMLSQKLINESNVTGSLETKKLEKLLNGIPLRGYETDCEKILVYFDEFVVAK